MRYNVYLYYSIICRPAKLSAKHISHASGIAFTPDPSTAWAETNVGFC